MRKEFWYAIVCMFLLSFLVPFISFEIIMYIEFICIAVTGYYYWQDQKEKEKRLRQLGEESEKRKRESS